MTGIPEIDLGDPQELYNYYNGEYDRPRGLYQMIPSTWTLLEPRTTRRRKPELRVNLWTEVWASRDGAPKTALLQQS